MVTQKMAEKIISDVNKEHETEIDIYDVLDMANFSPDQLRDAALRCAGVEPEEEPEEEESLAGKITRPEDYAALFERGMTALRKKSEAEKAERKAISQQWLRKQKTR